METKVLNYRIIIEPEKYSDGSVVYVASCPTLSISDYGDTIANQIITSTQFKAPASWRVAIT